ncbi:hypothetical protein M9Y10_019628 [Tritrichomonas musculus]|uniref:Uncharacterized protein n=1 Tax=Tritrichomonas musculus TaxID=1915356 RepID=A0ABR2HHU6_9EUKA
MIALILFLVSTNAEIPNRFKDLVSKAIINSKIKKIKKEKYDVTYPGDYETDGIKFRLKRTIVSYQTKGIKGFAIENDYLAIIKQKSFSFEDAFTFIDDNEQKYYDISENIFNDETDEVNIYSIKRVTIFDIITNFEYKSKKTRTYSQQIEINWEIQNEFPGTYPIPQSNSKVGSGFRGTLSIDTVIKFKRIEDISIRTEIELDGRFGSLIELHEDDFEHLNTLKIFDTEKIPIEDIQANFEFRGIEININGFIKAECHIIDNPFAKVDNYIMIEQEYRVSGKRSIEVTNYVTYDSNWELQVLPEIPKYGSEDFDKLSYSTEFRITPQLTFYYTLEFQLGDISSTFDCGLIFPMKFAFKVDYDKCVSPSIFGDVISSISSFYDIDDITIQYTTSQKNRINHTLIEKRSNTILTRKIDTSNSCIHFSSDFYEEINKNTQTGFYYQMRAASISERPKKGIDVQFHVEINDGTKITKIISPFVKYSVNAKGNLLGSSIILPNQFKNFSYYFYYLDDMELKRSNIIVENYEYTQTSSYDLKLEESCGKYNVKMTSLRGEYQIVENPFRMFTKYTNGVMFKYAPKEIQTYSVVDLNDGYPKTGSSFKTENYYDEGYVLQAYSGWYKFTDWKPKNPKGFIDICVGSISITLYHEDMFDSFHIIGYAIIGDSISGIEVHKEGSTLGKNGQSTKFYIALDKKPIMDIYFNSRKFAPGNEQCSNISESEIHFHYEKKDIEQIMRQSYIEFSLDRNIGFRIDLENTSENVLISPSDETEDNHKLVISNIEFKYLSLGGRFSRNFVENEVYIFYKLSCPACSLNKNFLFIKLHGATLLPFDNHKLSYDVNKLSKDTYCIYCRSDEITLSIRRTNNKAGEIIIEYIVSDANEIDNMEIDEKGIEVTFVNKDQPYTFIIKTHRNNGSIFNSAPTGLSLESYQIQINENLRLVSYRVPVARQDPIKFLPCFTVLGIGQMSVKYDMTFLKMTAGKKGVSCFDFYVYCDRPEVKRIRSSKHNMTATLDNNSLYAKFNIEFETIDNDEIDEFYAICDDENAVNCELTYYAEEGVYQLIELSNKDGLNTTARGQRLSIIQAAQEEAYPYYKLFKGTFKHIKSYGSKTSVTLNIEDVYPYDTINKDETTERSYRTYQANKEEEEKEEEDDEKEKDEEDEDKDEDEDKGEGEEMTREPTKQKPHLPSQSMTPSPSVTPVQHNMTGAYRRFCLKDESETILPFSAHYLTEEFEELIELLGGKKDFDETQVSIEEDECIHIDLKGLDHNINNMTSSIVDLGTSSGYLKLEDELVDYIPQANNNNIQKTKKKFNVKIIYFIIACVVVVAIIAVIIVVIVYLIRRKKRKTASTEEGATDVEGNRKPSSKKKSKAEYEDDNEDDQYYNTLLA